MTRFTIHDIFNDAEIRLAVKIWKHDHTHFHTRAIEEIIIPAMTRINVLTGQDNHPAFFAYMLEWAVRLLTSS